MQTLQPVLKRGRSSWNKINMPVSEFEQRVVGIRKAMIKDRIDVLLLYSNNLDNYGNSSYISNYIMETIGGTLVIIPAEGKVALVFEGGARVLPLVKNITWLEEIKTGASISNECVLYLKANNLIPATLGLAGLNQFMPHTEWRCFRESTSLCSLVNAEHIVNNTRMIKSTREVDQIRRSARITGNVFGTIANSRYPGLNERIIEAEAERYAFREGAADFRVLVGREGKSGVSFRPPADSPVGSGEVINIYLAVEFEGYWSEGIRPFVAQPHRSTASDIEDVKQQFAQLLLGELRTGKFISRCYHNISSGLKKIGNGYIPEIGVGNGIGLELEEFPLITESESTKLKSGMCLAVHAAFKSDDNIDILIGNTVYLSGNGPEILV